MSVAQYLLNWDSFNSHVRNGFSSLQKNEEFVDMTLAADGHFVKVHKSILALASPYIKSILQSAPNEHPIVFLSSVSHEVLTYILTYVYTGEVSVEVDKIHTFMRVAKDLRLRGLFGMPSPKGGSRENNNFHTDFKETRFEDNTRSNSENTIEESVNNHDTPGEINNKKYDSTILTTKNTEHNVNTGLQKNPDFVTNDELQNNKQSGLYITADGYQYKLEVHQPCDLVPNSTSNIVEDGSNNPSAFAEASNNGNGLVPNNSNNQNQIYTQLLPPIGSLDLNVHTAQYSMSSRGSLQLILNRFMYYCHHKSHGGRKRRWRCIEYRSKRCPAYIDTDNEIMISRKFGHTHSFHDEKIEKKMKRNLVFTNLNVLLEKNKSR